jgi:hypothetical protein
VYVNTAPAPLAVKVFPLMVPVPVEPSLLKREVAVFPFNVHVPVSVSVSVEAVPVAIRVVVVCVNIPPLAMARRSARISTFGLALCSTNGSGTVHGGEFQVPATD